MKNIITLVFGLVFAWNLQGQTGPASHPVRTELRYNNNTCLYEVWAHVQSGLRLVVPFNIPQPSKLTVILPTGTVSGSITNVTTHNPPGLTWTNSNRVDNPGALPGYDLRAFTIPGGGAANGYPNFEGGQSFILFTFPLDMDNCTEGLRMYVNGSDPNSAAPGMLGLDLTNSLKTAHPLYPQAVEQYEGNVNNTGTTLPRPDPTPSFNCGEQEINLMSNPPAGYPSCLSTYSYAWSGPNGFTSSAQDPVVMVEDKVGQSGTYSVMITDQNGCTAMESMDINGDVCETLPIEIFHFNIQKLGNNSWLEWIAPPLNTSENYEVQHSRNGIDFVTIGYRQRKDVIEEGSQHFTYIHENPGQGEHFYRIKWSSPEGFISFSDTKSIDFNGGGVNLGSLFIFPNPARNYIIVNNLLLSRESYPMFTIIYDHLGRPLTKQAFAPGQLMDVSNFSSGTYIVAVIDQANTVLGAGRFIKVN